MRFAPSAAPQAVRLRANACTMPSCKNYSVPLIRIALGSHLANRQSTIYLGTIAHLQVCMQVFSQVRLLPLSMPVSERPRTRSRTCERILTALVLAGSTPRRLALLACCVVFRRAARPSPTVSPAMDSLRIAALASNKSSDVAHVGTRTSLVIAKPALCFPCASGAATPAYQARRPGRAGSFALWPLAEAVRGFRKRAHHRCSRTDILCCTADSPPAREGGSSCGV